MSTEFKGLLQSPHKPSTALRISIVLSDAWVEVSNDLGFIGKWPSHEMSVERSANNWFKLRLDEEEWDFLPDDPTRFFLAAPINPTGPSRARPPVRRRALSKLSRGAIGAMLAVSLLSIGIVMGRNQLDGAVLVVTIMLVIAGALGAWWAASWVPGGEGSDRTNRSGAGLRTDRPRTALRVEDVIAGKEAARAAGSPLPRGADGEPDPSPATVAGDRDSESASQTARSEDRSLLDVPPPSRTRSDAPTAQADLQPVLETDEPDGADLPGTDSASFDDAFGARWQWGAAEPADSDGTGSPSGAQTPNTAGPKDPVLPTEAIKRYLAALAELDSEPPAEEQDDSSAGEVAGEAWDDSDGATETGLALTKIRGIGPALSTALTQLGVGDVRDLADLDSNDLDYLEEQLGRFGSRIKSQRWVEQARQMVRHR